MNIICDEDGMPVGFAAAYNRAFAGRPVDTRQLAACEEIWRAALASAPKAAPAPSWRDLQMLAAKHKCNVPGYGPFAAELLSLYGSAPTERPWWVSEWLNAMNYVQGLQRSAAQVQGGA